MSQAPPSEELLRRLRGIPLFEAMSPEDVQALVALMSLRKAAAGETLAAEGDTGAAMFILLSGAVRIRKRTVDNEPYTVAQREGADTPVFGELALLDDDRRSATIEAAQASELLELTREAFERFGDERPRAGLLAMRHLAKAVSGNLRRANEDAILLFSALVNEVRGKSSV